MRFKELFSNVHARPNMYGVGGDYKVLVAFVLGCDAATDGSLLQGFQEWLVVKVGYGSNIAWFQLILWLTFPDRASAELREEEHVLARAALMRELDEFLTVRENHGGMQEVYRTYLEWRAAGNE